VERAFVVDRLAVRGRLRRAREIRHGRSDDPALRVMNLAETGADVGGRRLLAVARWLATHRTADKTFILWDGSDVGRTRARSHPPVRSAGESILCSSRRPAYAARNASGCSPEGSMTGGTAVRPFIDPARPAQ
jgi:hypothetical protein